jgi:hypothetical protein
MWTSTLSLALLALPLIDATASPIVVRHMERRDDIHARQSTTQLPKMNITAWNAEASSACVTQLSKLNGKASNDAGMAVCYNLPFLDNSTGLFQADLRLYQIAKPAGDFLDVPAQDVSVGLQYFGATVQPLNMTAMAAKKRDLEFAQGYGISGGLKSLSWPVTRDVNEVEKRDVELMEQLWGRQTQVPTQIQGYMFVGQVNRTLFAKLTTT